MNRRLNNYKKRAGDVKPRTNNTHLYLEIRKLPSLFPPFPLYLLFLLLLYYFFLFYLSIRLSFASALSSALYWMIISPHPPLTVTKILSRQQREIVPTSFLCVSIITQCKLFIRSHHTHFVAILHTIFVTCRSQMTDVFDSSFFQGKTKMN